MMNRLFKRGMVIALAAAMTTSAGIPAMAAQKETQEETVTTSEVTQTNVDMVLSLRRRLKSLTPFMTDLTLSTKR